MHYKRNHSTATTLEPDPATDWAKMSHSRVGTTMGKSDFSTKWWAKHMRRAPVVGRLRKIDYKRIIFPHQLNQDQICVILSITPSLVAFDTIKLLPCVGRQEFSNKIDDNLNRTSTDPGFPSKG
ncbi:hypothetical protein Droror1_Dr00026461 [Drosera rotundifolia]